jgi:streptomycin 3"-adenylyltransferase
MEITKQLSEARDIIERYTASKLQAIHLYGSALDGGLKPNSDIDLLATVSSPLDQTIRQALLLDLLKVSAPPGKDTLRRALEVTVIVHTEVVPWRYPPKRELQFGEWLRKDLMAGIFDSPVLDFDLAVLLRKARQHSTALVGPAAEELFESVPDHDFFKALADTLQQWNSPADWKDDELNIVLTLARIWYSAAMGNIVPKDIAAGWLLRRLPDKFRPLMREAQQAYQGRGKDNLAAYSDLLPAFIFFAKSKITHLLEIQKT